jgi:hypothetical protein
VAVVGAIPQLAFAVLDAAPVRHTAAPLLRFRVEVECLSGEPIRSLLLDTQVQLAARRRAYDAAAHDRLFELFGPTPNWGTTLRTLLWTRATLVVPPFAGSTEVELPIVCTYDLDVAASRYFDALADGEVPLEFLFSGTAFYSAADGRLQTVRIPWDREAEYRLPVAVWRSTIDHHFPGSAWLRLDRETHDRLVAYKSRRALPTWGAVLDELLPEGGSGSGSEAGA